MHNGMNISNLRKEYKMSALSEAGLPHDPFMLFGRWFGECMAAGVAEPNAMVLASTAGNLPSARVVLLKELAPNGFIFFTNFESRKGRELAVNPYAALVFFWPELERQVRVEGDVARVGEAYSRDYFNSRPYESRISAVISPQSSVIPSREYLDKLHSNFRNEHSGEHIDKPANWGGFVLIPSRLEFWQGRPDRLHDRIVYEKVGDEWKISRLAP